MPSHGPHFDRIAVVGVGLIGGSIALSAKRHVVAREVVGLGRNPNRLAAAVEQGVIDRYVTDPAELRDIDLAIVCTPVDRIVKDVQTLLENTPSRTLVTDAGSVKGSICTALTSSVERFVGSHPLAGSHHAGFEHASANLFENRLCILTPTETTPAHVTTEVELFWQLIGMQVHRMSPLVHDEVLSVTSHIPHLAAAAVASMVDEDSVTFASSGFRDTTRIAAGDPDLWTAIFLTNAEQLTHSTDRLISILHKFRDTISRGDAAHLRELLSQARTQRNLFDRRHAPPENKRNA